jgi:membrane protein implicated in regulation of membrane protease activity
VSRIRYIVLIGGAVAATAALVLSSAPTGGAQGGGLSLAPATVVMSAIDLHWRSGDENEPDENESAGDQTSAQPSPRKGADRAAALWPKLTIGAVVAALVVAAIVVVARWIRRYRAWKRRMAYRTRVWARRLGDDLERMRRRGFRS